MQKIICFMRIGSLLCNLISKDSELITILLACWFEWLDRSCVPHIHYGDQTHDSTAKDSNYVGSLGAKPPWMTRHFPLQEYVNVLKWNNYLKAFLHKLWKLYSITLCSPLGSNMSSPTWILFCSSEQGHRDRGRPTETILGRQDIPCGVWIPHIAECP